MVLTLLLGPNAGGLPEDVPESAAEDVAFVGGHLERFLDGIGEAVAREAEVLEHGQLNNLYFTDIT